MRSHEKTEDLRVCVHLPYHVEYSHDDIVATSSLSTTQHETNLQITLSIVLLLL